MWIKLFTILALTSVAFSITQLNFGLPRRGGANRGQTQEYFLEYLGDEEQSYISCTARSLNGVGLFRLSMSLGQINYVWPLPSGYFSSNVTVSNEELLMPVVGRWSVTLNACGNCREWTEGSSNFEILCDLVPFGESQLLEDGEATTRVIGRGLNTYFYFDVPENDYPQFFDLNVVANISNALRVSYSRTGFPVGNNYERMVPSSGWTNISTFNNQPQISQISAPGRYFVRVETCGSCSPYANGGYIEFNITHTIRSWGTKETLLGNYPLLGNLPLGHANYYWVDLPRGFYSASITAHPEPPFGGQYRLCISKILPILGNRPAACTNSYLPTPTLDYIPQSDEFGTYIVGIFQCPSCRFANDFYPGYHINATYLV